MLGIIAILLSCLLGYVSAQSRFVFGPFYGWRYPDVKSYIARAETTLCPGNTPSPEMQRASMWMGMEAQNTNSTQKRNLIQAIIVSDPDLYRRKCNGTVGDWCTFAAVLSGLMVEGRHQPMASGECVHIKYQYNNDTGAYDQTLSIGEKVVSTLSYNSGKALNIYMQVEIHDQFEGVVNEHKYINTTIELAEPELNFGRRAIAKGAKGTRAETTDSGKTWTVNEIHIAASKYGPTGRNYQVIGYSSDQPIKQTYSSIDVSLIS